MFADGEVIPMQIDIIKLAEILGACSVILGAIIGGYKLYDKRLDKFEEHERRICMLEAEVKRTKGENALIIDCLYACLDGLKQLGADGEVSDTIKRLKKHTNKTAHDQD